MVYDPALPTPTQNDLDNLRVEDPAWWSCRFCGFTESGPMTTDAQARRCAAHEYRCQHRPFADTPFPHEWAAYQFVHAAGLRRDLDLLSRGLDDRRELLNRTWFLDFAGRRAHKDAIADLNGRIAGVHAYALTLGLGDGWSNPDFRPSELR